MATSPVPLAPGNPVPAGSAVTHRTCFTNLPHIGPRRLQYFLIVHISAPFLPLFLRQLRNSSQRCNYCANSINISRPLENAGTWRGTFKPSTVAFGTERKRVCVGYAICATLTSLKEFLNYLVYSHLLSAHSSPKGTIAGIFSGWGPICFSIQTI